MSIAPTPQMVEFRQRIDDLDRKIIDLLGARFDIIAEVAAHKKAHNIPSVLADRVEEVKENAAKLGQDRAIDPDFMRRLYAIIIDHACACEDKVIKG